MAVEGKEVTLHIRKVLIYSIITSYKSARDHPCIFSVVCVMLVLYKSFPSLFAFLVSSSPVLICTALLLGTLLSYGEPNIHKIEEVGKRTQEFSSLKVCSSASDLVVRKDESCTVETHVESQRPLEGIAVKEAVSGEKGASPHCEVEENIPFATIHDEGDEKDDILVARSSAKEDKKEIHGEEIVTEERKLHEQEIAKKKEFTIQNVAEGVLKVDKHIDGFTATDQIGNEGLKVEINKPTLDSHFDSSLGSPWQHINIRDASSDSECDQAESSSPDACISNIIPMLDELHPLLDSETQPALLSKGSMDGASHGSSHDHESDDDSMEEEAENQEDEEAQEENDDGAEAAVTWTADDQKNVMDLGSSELARNRRLESLIAKQRARKDIRFETERNLIDLDSSMKELSRFHVQIPPISAPRRNPFDLPYDSEESMGLPPIPDSAPCVLLPRRNPFDFPYDQVDVSSIRSVETSRHRDFASDLQRDMFFRRNETVNLGDTKFKQEKQESRLKPYFSVERMDSEETSSAALQRQLSDKSNSKVSSVPDSDTDSSVTDQEYHKVPVEQEPCQEAELPSPSDANAEPVEWVTQSSEELESVKVEQEKSEINVANDHGTRIDAHIVVDETLQAAESFGAVEEEIRDEVDTILTISDAEKLEVIEEKYEQSNPSSSEEDEKNPRSGIGEQSANLEKTRDAMLAVDDSYHLSMEERACDCYVANPIYDSSPSAIRKSLSNISEASSDGGKGGPDTSSLKFEMQHVGSSPWPVERNVNSGIGSTGEELASSTGGLWVASTKLASEYESRSKEITELREPAVIEVGLQPVHKNASDPIAPILSGPAAMDIMHQLRINVDVSHQTEGNKMIDTPTSSYSDSLLLSDRLISSALEKAQSTEKSGIQTSSEVGVGESHISILDLPPIPEENLNDDKPEEEHENLTKPESSVGLTGSQILEEPRIVISNIERELSLLQRKSAEGSEVDGNWRLAHEPEDASPRVVSPVSIHDDSFTGLEFLEPKERVDFSILPEAKSELEMKSSTVLTNSREDIIDAVQREREGYSQQNINDSDEESDKVHPDVINIRGIDENLLSELDVVGDFHVEELRSEQQGSELGESDDIAASSLTSEMHEITSKLQVSEVRSTEYADMSLNLSSEANLNLPEELHSVIDQPKSVESEVGSSFESSFVNPEQAVYNPRLHLLEASSSEIDSVFKQHHEESGVPSASEPIVGECKTMSSEVSASELVIAERDPEQTIADSGMLILEAKSVEDINSAFNKLIEVGLGKSIVPEVGPSQTLPGGLHFEPMEIHSSLQIVEAKSFEDIHLAFKQASDAIYENPPKVTKLNVGCTEVETSDRHLEPDVLKARSAGEIELAFKEAVSKDAGSSEQQTAGKSGGVEKIYYDSGSDASTSEKTKKKNKSAKSGSSSSSSSSSSDSD